MKVKLFIVLVVALGFLAPGVALSQPSVKAKFYIFPTMNIDGDHKAPTVTYSSPKKRAEFGRLAKLKKSFFPELQKSGKDLVLK